MPPGITISDVARALIPPLPGPDAQRRMSTKPRPAPPGDHPDQPPRQAAVLILFYPRDGQLFLPLTRRTERVANHKAEIALPGGAWEAGDSSLWHTAARESFEEIGVEPHTVHRLGALSPLYIPTSNFKLCPFVGHVRFRPSFVIDTREVAELIEFPLPALLDPCARSEEWREIRGQRVRVPFYRCEQHVVWGATAMVLSEMEVALALALDAG